MCVYGAGRGGCVWRLGDGVGVVGWGEGEGRRGEFQVILLPVSPIKNTQQWPGFIYFFNRNT